MPGSRNLIGVKDPIVDELIGKIITADSREELIAACRALDRVLLWSHYVIPQWHNRVTRIAYWDKLPTRRRGRATGSTCSPGGPIPRPRPRSTRRAGAWARRRTEPADPCWPISSAACC